VPSEAGRALSSGRTRRIGLLLTDLENQFYQYVIAPIHRELEALGYQLVLQTETSDTGQVTERLLGNGLQGVLLATTTLDSVLPVRLRDRGVPFVYFNRISAAVESDQVVVDPTGGLKEAADSLVRFGHRRVAAIFGPHNTSTGERREAALREALEDHGLPIASRYVQRGPFDFESGFAGARQLLSLSERPTAIVCGNDVVALGALNAARELDVAVPGQVSIVGFDDLPVASWPIVRLTTVAFDLEVMARAAASLLVRRLEAGEQSPFETLTFSSRLVQRDTLAAAAS
jgi:LacI family transcriptional regulator